jgi:hypothetical protein
MSFRPTGDNGSPFWQPPDEDELDEDRAIARTILFIVMFVLLIFAFEWLLSLLP